MKEMIILQITTPSCKIKVRIHDTMRTMVNIKKKVLPVEEYYQLVKEWVIQHLNQRHKIQENMNTRMNDRMKEMHVNRLNNKKDSIITF